MSFIEKDTLRGTRTHNLWIRSPTRYPLRQQGLESHTDFLKSQRLYEKVIEMHPFQILELYRNLRLRSWSEGMISGEQTEVCKLPLN